MEMFRITFPQFVWATGKTGAGDGSTSSNRLAPQGLVRFTLLASLKAIKGEAFLFSSLRAPLLRQNSHAAPACSEVVGAGETEGAEGAKDAEDTEVIKTS